MPQTPILTSIAILSALILSGCASLGGLDRTDPALAQESYAWSDYLMTNGLDAQFAETQWWREFEDPVLNTLIDTALADNLDLALAAERIGEARLLAQRDRAGLNPRLDLTGSVTSQRLSETSTLPAGRVPGFEAETVVFKAGFDARWELDLFGRGETLKALGEARIASAMHMRRDAALLIISEIARHYIGLRAAQAELALIDQNIDRQTQIAELTKVKRDYGEASDFDVERAELLTREFEAMRPAQHQRIRSAKTSLAVLTGASPSAPPAGLERIRPLPEPPRQVGAGLTSDLLRRRPDIRGAEIDYAIAAKQADLTKLATFPRFSLFASGGPETTSLTDLIDIDSLALTLGALVSWSLYDGGRQNIDEARASSKLAQAEITYRQTVLRAFEDVELAAGRYITQGQRAENQAQIVTSRRRIADMSRTRYEAGTGTLLDVLDTERELATAELQLTRIKAEQITQLLSLYKALGGGLGS